MFTNFAAYQIQPKEKPDLYTLSKSVFYMKANLASQMKSPEWRPTRTGRGWHVGGPSAPQDTNLVLGNDGPPLGYIHPRDLQGGFL